MKHIYKTAIATGISLVTLFFTATTVYADGASATPTKTPTPTPVQETRVECTTGAYGQQTCKTVLVDRIASPSGVPAHQVVNTGIAENIVFTILGVFILSTFGYTYSKVDLRNRL